MITSIATSHFDCTTVSRAPGLGLGLNDGPSSICFRSLALITKTCLYNFDPLKPHFYIVKLGFTGVYIFHISAQKHRLWVLVRTASPVPTIYVLSRNMKNIIFFLSENFQFLEVNFSIYLNWRVFVMLTIAICGRGHRDLTCDLLFFSSFRLP